jgi:ABC-type dipeptide/oligopeptide/nickel transport system permease subunit
VALAFAGLAIRTPRVPITSGVLGVALGVASAVAMHAIDHLLPAIAAIALALPAGALIALLSRRLH